MKNGERGGVARTVGAIVAGLAATIGLAYATDAVLRLGGAGLADDGGLPRDGSTLLVLSVLSYRTVFSVIGCFVAARLAPRHPMRHALALGLIGVVASASGAATVESTAPAWYAWGLVVLALPAAWLGGALAAGRTVRPDPVGSPEVIASPATRT